MSGIWLRAAAKLASGASLLALGSGAAFGQVATAPGTQQVDSSASQVASGESVQSADQQPAAQQSTGGTGLADIVVTAQRRSENLQRVPIAVVATSGEALQSSAITTTVQLNAIAPGLNIRTTNGAFNPFIRGIGTSSNIVENPVSLYIDGVYLPQQREGLRELNDIQQIAVLKGPQGTLFGRNATGGVIQITTLAPSHSFHAQAGAEIDNYATVRTDAYLTGPLSETLAFSLSGQYAKQFDGYGRNYTTGNDTYQLLHQFSTRGKLLFEPWHGTKFTLIGDYMDRYARNNSFVARPGTVFAIPNFRPVANRYDTYSGVDPYTSFVGGGVSLTAEQELGFARLVSISAYRKGEGRYLLSSAADASNSFLVYSNDAPNRMFSQELQLVSRPGVFSWVLGGYYFNNRNANNPVTIALAGALSPLPQTPKTIDNYGEERTESVAPFGQADWKVLRDTTITGGVRWTYERRSAVLSRVTTLNNGFVAQPPAVIGSVTIRQPTYRLAISQQFNPDILGYVSFNTGFKSGGFNITNSSNPSYLPEKLKAYEVGLKAQLLEHRLRLNTAAYYYDYTNLQVARFANGTQLIANGAAAKLYGLDVDLEAQIGREFRVTGGLALEHTEFTSYPNAVFAIPQPNGTVTLTPGDAKGNRLPLAQEVSGSLAVNWHHDLPAGAVEANVNANYNGNYFFEADNGVQRQGPYTMLNSSLRYTLPGDRVTLGVFGRNLLDAKVLSFATTQTFGFNSNYAPPRTYGVSLRVAY